jgi:hypothetical protein
MFWGAIPARCAGLISSCAVDKLKTATRIIIIGFSMPPTDLHFKYLLASGLKENISLRQILFVNPDTKTVKDRALSIFRPEHIESAKIQFEANSLESFLTHFGYSDWIGRQ